MKEVKQMSEKIKDNKEVRLASISNFNIEMREAEEGGKDNEMIIEGYAAVFDTETLIGDEEWGFYEKIDRKAFDGANMKDVPLKYNHCDNVPILARTRNKSLELTVDDKGLFIRAKLIDTQDNRDMYKRIKEGLIDKMSFAFTTKEQGEEWEKGDVPHRTIKQFDRIFDVSVVDMPAYEDTSIYARSREKSEDFKRTVETVPSKKNIRKNPIYNYYF